MRFARPGRASYRRGMTQTPASELPADTSARPLRHPVRALVAKVVAGVVGCAVVLAGIAMLVLPGPGLVVIGVGVGVLATEWPWASRLLAAATGRLVALLFPRGGSRGRRLLGGVAVLAAGAAGFAATSAVTVALGSTALA